MDEDFSISLVIGKGIIMKAGQLLSRNTKRKKLATDFWLRVATDINGGMTPDEVAGRYKNPKTGKPYTVKHIYWVIRQLGIARY